MTHPLRCFMNVVDMLYEGRIYQIEGSRYSLATKVLSDPSMTQARTFIASIRSKSKHHGILLRGLMYVQTVYIWEAYFLTHDEVRLSLMPEIREHSSDLATFEISDYSMSITSGDQTFVKHKAKFTPMSPSDYNPRISPFVINIMTAIDENSPERDIEPPPPLRL